LIYFNGVSLTIRPDGLLQAEAAYRQILTLDPAHAEAHAHHNLGVALGALGRMTEAETSFGEALRLWPNYLEAHHNLGNALYDLRRPAEAVLAYEKAVSLNPDHSNATGKLLMSSRQICDWSRISAIEDRIGMMVAQGHGLGPSEMLIMPALTGADHKRIARLYAEKVHGAALSLPPIVQAWRGRTAACGSATSRRIITSMPPRTSSRVFSTHDPARVEVFCYSTGAPILDAARRRIIEGCGTFRDFHELSDEAAARIVAADGIDILVDLKGYTARGRLGIQARRPAPLVVSWLGYPGDAGRAAPRRLHHRRSRRDATRNGRRLQRDARAVAPLLSARRQHKADWAAHHARAQAGLPDEALVLCNFNASYKISPAVFSLWLEVLRQVPDSVLWLLHTASEVVDNLRREAALRHIAPQRLVFATRLPVTQHLGRLQLADLTVDTFPFTSHTTGSDALSRRRLDEAPTRTSAAARSCSATSTKSGKSKTPRVGIFSASTRPGGRHCCNPSKPCARTDPDQIASREHWGRPYRSRTAALQRQGQDRAGQKAIPYCLRPVASRRADRQA
jgi:hypothetical protein